MSRLSGKELLLKATRLAHLTGSDAEREWLSYEMLGYRDTELRREYIGLTGRWIDQRAGTANFGPLAQQEAEIEALQVQLK
jgi:AbiTii-like protein